MPYPYNKTPNYPCLTEPWYLDVRDYGATGNGSTDDTAAIQAALNTAESYGGGIVFFPPGTYLISATLLLPSKVYMKGVAGTTYNFIDTTTDYNTPSLPDTKNFFLKVNTVLRLIDGLSTGISMIEPKTPNEFCSAGIENMIFDGNKANITGSNYYGIKIVDAPSPTYYGGNRSQAQFRNIIVYHVKGTGFYGGYNQHELFLDWVTAFGCDSDGIVLRGEDIKGTRIASGANAGIGIKLPGSGSATIASGAGRFIDVDCWSNRIGIEISDTMGYVFFGLVINSNRQGGLYIHSTTPQPPGFSPGNIRIYRGGFGNNSTDAHNSYSEIKIEPNASGFGPFDIALIGCQFHGWEDSAQPPPPPKKPKYVIEDSSTYARRCIVTGGFFKMSNYGTGISNKPQAIRDCFNYEKGDIISDTDVGMHYAWVGATAQSPNPLTYNIAIGEGFLVVDTQNLRNIEVNLPAIGNISTGRVLYISRGDPYTNFSVTIKAAQGDNINGVQSVSLTGQYQAYMIVHAGSGWFAVKIA